MLAENEGKMRSLLKGLEEYLGRKRLVLNENKTKIRRFRKGDERMRRWIGGGRIK